MKDSDFFEELRTRFNKGEQFSFLHFWGHQPGKNGSISHSCFSQWFEAEFIVDDVHYKTAEHFTMASKAQLFDDHEIYRQILNAPNPAVAKALGRKTKNWDESLWIERRFDIVIKANREKFTQNPVLGQYLIGTSEKILVEASPVDNIWGIGLAASDPNVNDPNYWNGLNLLGFALMKVRDELKERV